MKQFYLKKILSILILLLSSVACFAQLNANFTASATSGCNPMVVQFTNTSTGSPVSYSWDFGNGVNSSLQNPSTTYTTAGSFTVTLTVTSASGATNTKTVTNYITVYNPPTVNFTVDDTAGCPPHTANFISQVTLNAPGTGNYFWTFGTGSTVVAQNPTFTFPDPGYFTVTHVVVNSAGCTTTHQKPAYIHVFTPPVANFGANEILCGPGPAIFTNMTTGTGPLTYEWAFGDGGTSTAANPTHNYTALGTYDVQLTVTDANGCKDTILKPGYITVVPTQAFFTAPLSACEDEPVTLSNTTPFTIYANWDFGDGTPSDTNQTVTHIYTTPGTYTISLAVHNGTCIVYKAQQITIHPKPVVSFTASTQNPCPAPVTVQFTNTSTYGASFTWYFGDGTTSSQANPTHVYTQNGFYDVKLVVTSSHGCADSLELLQYVKIFPSVLSIDAVPGDGCIPVSDTFAAVLSSFNPAVGGSVPYPATITSYSWDFGDGTYSTASNPVHVYNNVGSYTVKLNIVTSNGCTDSASIVVNTGTPPIPNFYTIPTTACVDQEIQFINTSTNALTYEWLFGNGSSSSASNPITTYPDPGIYTVTLIANNNGCIDTLVIPDYITINYPKASFTTAYLCDTLTKVGFTNLSLGYDSCFWDFGDGTTSTLNSPTHVYPSLGSFTATLVVYNDTTGCTDTTTTTVDLFNPSPSFTANDTAICPTTEVIFTASFPGSQFVQRYNWIFDGYLVPDTLSTIIWPYYSPGYHDVSLVIQDAHGCWDTVVKNDYIIVGHPTVDFTASPVNVCVPGTVTFTNTSFLPAGTTVATSYWQFGNGQTYTGTGLTAGTTYTGIGNYDVELVVTDNIGCSDSLEKPDFVHAHDPTANFNVTNTNGCVGAPMPFLSLSMGVQLSYLWDFGDGTTSTAPIPQHIYYQTGTYTVKLMITDIYGCTDTMIKPNYVTIWNNPVASFTLSDTFRICPPLFVQTTNTSTPNLVYNWNMGDGTTNSAVNPSHIYVDPGIYNMRLIAINNYGCRDTAYKQVRILGYDGLISYSPLTGCAPLTVNFSANVQNVPGLVWDFADGTTLATTDTFASHTYLEPGPRVPRLIMTDNAGCASTSYGLDTIKVDGVYAGFTYSPYPACDSGTLTFLDTSKGAYSTVTSRQWLFHSGAISTSISPSHHYPAPGDYIIKLYTETSTGCLDTLTDTLTFYPLPVISAGADTVICLGDSATLMPSGGLSYEWSPAPTLSCANCTNPLAGPTVPTMYTVIGTDVHGCKNTDSVNVELKTKTDADVEEGGEICDGEEFQLQVSGAHSYEWLPPGSLDNPSSDHPVATPDTTITYIVISREGSCVPDTDYVTVVVHPLPGVDAGPDQTIVAGDVAYIDAAGTNVFRWEWTPVESLSCGDCEDPAATPKKTTTYTVNVYTDFGCMDTDDITVHVICKESQVFMPNTFTPNGDGQNDIFYPRGKGIEIIKSFRIYNRWGEVVFEKRNMDTNELTNGWDGTYKGQQLPPDVFLYIVDAICDTGEPVTWKGDINLVR